MRQAGVPVIGPWELQEFPTPTPLNSGILAGTVYSLYTIYTVYRLSCCLSSGLFRNSLLYADWHWQLCYGLTQAEC